MPRLFIAVEIPGKLEPQLKDLQSRLAVTSAEFIFTNPSQAHFTLKFIGNTDPDRMPEIEKVINEVVSEKDRFSLSLGGVGVFPSMEHINVVWVGVTDGDEELSELQAALEERLVKEGIAGPEEYSFTPHVTLGRMKTGKGKSEVQRFVEENQDLDLGDMDVISVKLKESKLTDEGSVHSTRFTASLKRSDGADIDG